MSTPEPDPDDADRSPMRLTCAILLVLSAMMGILTVAIVWAIKHL